MHNSTRLTPCARRGAAIAFALAALAIPSAAFGQPWTGVLSPSRATDWRNAGLPATLPTGEIPPNPWTPPPRTQVCATIAPEGTSTAPVPPTDLNAAIQTCPAGQVVQLQAGSYYFNNTIDLYCTTTSPCALNGVTLRGAGADQTKIYFSSGASFAMGGNQYAHWTTLAAAPAPGATTVQLSAPDSEITPGIMIGITQCTTGASGTVSSGNGLACTASNGLAIYDNGGEFVCNQDGPFCSHGLLSTQTSTLNDEATQGQVQAVQVTAVSGTTLTVTPPIFLDDLSMANTLAVWDGYPTAIGIGLEDVSLDFTASTASDDFSFDGCYGCWVKGTRIIAGVNATQAFVMDRLVQYLVSNNYLFAFNSGNYGFLNGGSYGLSSGLVLNNITEHLCGIEWSGTGEVLAYNYSLPEVSENYFSHTGGTSSNLLEGNHAVQFTDDGIHGTHDFTTAFRNRFDGLAGGVYNGAGFIQPLNVAAASRFDNIVGNVLGTPGVESSYVNGANPVYTLGILDMRGGVGSALFDPTTEATALLWGNYDTFHGSVQWNASEVPSGLNTWTGHQQQIGTGDGATKTFAATLANAPVQSGDVIVGDNQDVFFAYDNGSGGWDPYGLYNGVPTQPATAGSINYMTGALSITFAVAPSAGAVLFANYLSPTQTASPYRNPVPPQTLPPSFFLPVSSAHPSGGTGLSWWKVCTNYPACTTFSTPPFPPIGPDVSGGPGPGGFAFAIPAEVAFQNLPVDPAYEEPVSVSGVTWSGGVATVTLASVPALANDGEYHYLSGQFTVSGVTPSNYNGTFQVASSTCNGTCTVTYALAQNPGTYASG
jgi:hypothetical protein